MCFNKLFENLFSEESFAEGVTPKDAASAASMSFGFGVLGPALSFVGQGIAASEARKAQREAVKQNRMNAIAEANAIYNGLAMQDMQRAEAAALEIEAVTSEANKRLARSTVAAAEAGTTGQSVQDVANDIRAAELGYANVVRRQEMYAQAQSNMEREAAYDQAAARIGGYQLPPISGPNPFTLLAGIGSSYMETLAKYKYGPAQLANLYSQTDKAT
jgi:hypothetical protein